MEQVKAYKRSKEDREIIGTFVGREGRDYLVKREDGTVVKARIIVPIVNAENEEKALPAINESNIYEKGVLIATRAGNYDGNTRLSPDLLKDLPKEIVRGVHDLFDRDFKEMIRDIIKHNGTTRAMIKRMAVPFPVDGVFFLKNEKISKAIKLVEERDEVRKELVAKAVEKYDTAIKEFSDKYPLLYSRAKGKYISKEEFASRFFFTYQLIKINPPDKDSPVISTEQYEAEYKKFKETVEEMRNDVVSTIYQSLMEMTCKLKKQLTEDKPNESTIKSINSFLLKIEEVYSDFVDRKDLAKAAEDVKAAMIGISAEDLRSKEGLKDEFARKVDELVSTIKAIPDIPLKRAIDF